MSRFQFPAGCFFSACHLRPPVDSETKLRNQLGLHRARVREIDIALNTCDARKKAAIRAGSRDEAREAVMEKVRLKKKRSKIAQLEEFCCKTLDGITDAAAVRETVAVMSEVAMRHKEMANMEKVYDKLGQVTEGLSEFNSDLDATHVLMSKNDYAQEEELEQELAALEEEFTADSVDALPAPPRVQLFAHPDPARQAYSKTAVFNTL